MRAYTPMDFALFVQNSDFINRLEMTDMDNSKVFAMKLCRIYPLLVSKAVKNGRTKDEVDSVIFWLTGYDSKSLADQLDKDIDYSTFFEEAPLMNPDWKKIKGTICGCRIEDISDEMMRKIRCLDKLVDELAKGKSLEKITVR